MIEEIEVLSMEDSAAKVASRVGDAVSCILASLYLSEVSKNSEILCLAVASCLLILIYLVPYLLQPHQQVISARELGLR